MARSGVDDYCVKRESRQEEDYLIDADYMEEATEIKNLWLFHNQIQRSSDADEYRTDSAPMHMYDPPTPDVSSCKMRPRKLLIITPKDIQERRAVSYQRKQPASGYLHSFGILAIVVLDIVQGVAHGRHPRSLGAGVQSGIFCA